MLGLNGKIIVNQYPIIEYKGPPDKATITTNILKKVGSLQYAQGRFGRILRPGHI